MRPRPQRRARSRPATTARTRDDADVTIECPDLEVVKDGNGTINAGENAVFTITLTNHGPGARQGRHAVRPAAGRVLDPRRRRQGRLLDQRQQPADLRLRDVANGGHRTITLTRATTADDCGSIPNTVTVAASNENTATDQFPNTDNATIVVQCPDISVVKDGNGPLSAGQTATFSITLSATPVRATPSDVTLSDQLPAGTGPSVADNAGDCKIDGSNLLTCDFGTILSGGTRSFTDQQDHRGGRLPVHPQRRHRRGLQRAANGDREQQHRRRRRRRTAPTSRSSSPATGRSRPARRPRSRSSSRTSARARRSA